MVQAVIFDLDGTILDNESDWEVVFGEVVDKNSLKIDSKLPNGWIHEPGLGIESNWRKLVLDPKKAEDLSRETWTWYQQKFLAGDFELKIRPGVEEVLERVKERGWRTALSTGSIWSVVEHELEQLNLYLAFDVTTTGEEVLMAKPDPEIYLLTALKMGLDPENCLVIEDAIAGVRAAVEAGMKAVGLVSDYAPEAMLRAAGATEVIAGFADFTV